MRAVKSRDTTPERAVMQLARELGYSYRAHHKALPGSPDLVFRDRSRVVFVHGCFWHGHACARGARVPKTNVAYWVSKIKRNKARDRQDRAALKALGWKTLVIWECQLKSRTSAIRLLRKHLELPAGTKGAGRRAVRRKSE